MSLAGLLTPVVLIAGLWHGAGPAVGGPPHARTAGGAAISLHVDYTPVRAFGSQHYTLTCGPVFGTMPHRRAACAAIAMHPEMAFAGPGHGHSCPPSSSVQIRGRYNGRHVNVGFSPCVSGQGDGFVLWTGFLPSPLDIDRIRPGRALGPLRRRADLPASGDELRGGGIHAPILALNAPQMAYNPTMARQRSGDLFPTEQPIPASQMIGRAADVREIASTLAGGSSVVLTGARRTGKTSVCDAVLGTLAKDGFYTVSIDLFRIATQAELAEALVAATIANRSAMRKTLHQARRAGRLVADAVQTSAVLKSKAQLGEEIEIAFTPGLAARDPERYLDYALTLPGRVADADGRQIAVFFDEFQEIAGARQPYGDPDRLTKRMRAIFQRASGVSCLFAGSLQHTMRDLFIPSHRALHQFGTFHDLRAIEADAWRSGLAERFEADDCSIEDGALRRIVEYGESHPRTTMLIAQKSHLTTIELDVRHVDLDIVEQGLDGAMRAERAAHEQTVGRIRSEHRLGLVVAERIARDQPVYRQLPRGAVRRALEGLRDASIIESRGRGDWRFSSPLLRRYIAATLPFG